MGLAIDLMESFLAEIEDHLKKNEVAKAAEKVGRLKGMLKRHSERSDRLLKLNELAQEIRRKQK